LNWSRAGLLQLAAALGSDVPFFLANPAALCRGRGEQIEEVSNLRRRPIVIIRPLVGLSTPAVYKRCRPNPSPEKTAQDCVDEWNRVGDKGLQQRMVNRLEEPARELSPWIETASAGLKLSGLAAQQMSGSGSSVLGIARTMRHARRAAARLRCMGIGSAAATTCPGWSGTSVAGEEGRNKTNL